MKRWRKPSRAEGIGILILAAAFAAFFISGLLSAALFLLWVVLCVVACFIPQMNFLGPVISRGSTGENKVALTFDDGPCPVITPKILDLLDRHCVKATFFVSGVNALQYSDLITEIIRRGHTIGNHSQHHNPFIMLKSFQALYREVDEARRVLLNLGVSTLAFRPPVGIVNPKLFPILNQLGLFCVTFNCRARDAGNVRVKRLAAKILKKVKGDDIILLHDRLPRRSGDEAVLIEEVEKVLTGVGDKGLSIVPLPVLIGKQLMHLTPAD